MAQHPNIQHVSVNALAAPLLQKLIKGAKSFGIEVTQLDNGCTIIDAGIKTEGSIRAGLLIAEICMGGLGKVSVKKSKQFEHCPLLVDVHSQTPVLACLGSQYAGWALQHEKFFSLGSGPARAIAQREELFKELNYQDSAEATMLVLETEKIPPIEVINKVAQDTRVKAENLTFILTPTKSLAGTVQIVGRVLEVALHKAHTIHFPLAQIISGAGTAPIPPVSDDFLTAMGRTNDAILFGGFVQLQVKSSDKEAEKLSQELPSCASKDYGRPFAEVFKAVNMDFYQIDPLLFSPAKVSIKNMATGKTFTGGELNESLINKSFLS